ncbi:glycosyltransferase family 2 protein [Leptotrichia sp. HSP-342]|uniref:Glycosyltransferase family 2 protein n=1 Tax=Leptotrichia mesophila TaxID=3239303 RepID=A0AB39VAG8_9FUSO
MKKLSVIIPVYFNEMNIPKLYEKLMEVLKNNRFCYEIIFVDDGSQDNSYLELLKVREKDKNIKILKLSKNYGSHTAILAGMSHITGDCVTVLSADLQDPPEIIEKMFEKWLEGNKVVLAVRESREESFLQTFISNTYYKLMQRFALKNMPKGGFDCFLIDKQVCKKVAEMKEKNTSIMGQILWCGFKTEKIYYTRREREEGKSRWTLSKKIKLFVDSFLSFSYFPIRFMSFLGFIFAIFGFFGIIYLIFNKLFNNISIKGWTSMIAIVLIVSGVQMLITSIIGEYVWRILDEVKNRPNYIIEEEVGFDEK